MKEKEEMTVDELLEAIRAEKQALIKAGKLKPEKALPPIKPEEVPFPIPSTWKWVRLGELGETCIGLTYHPADIVKDGTPVLRANNIQNGKMVYEDLVCVKGPVPQAKMCNIGDILICVRNGSARLVGKATIVNQKGMSFGAFMAIFRSRLNPYLIHFFASRYFRESFCSDVNTTTINQITQLMLRNVLVPLPPLGVQRVIAERLEKQLADVEAMEAHFQTMAETAQQTFKSTLVETFDTLTTPKVKLEEVCEIETGSSNTVDALTEGKYPFYDRSRIVKRSNRYLFDQPKAIIIPGEGATFPPRLVSGKYDLHQRAYTLYPKETATKDLCVSFLALFILSNGNYLIRVATGSTVKSLRKWMFAQMEIPLPSLAEQEAVAERLTGVQGRCEEMERLAREGQAWCKTLRKALLEEAFRN